MSEPTSSETIDDQQTSHGVSRGQPGVVIVFCARFPSFTFVPLEGSSIRLGRGSGFGLEIDGRLSREHAELSVEAGAWTVTDLESRNGVFVDGVRLARTRTYERAPRVVRMGQTIVLPLLDGWAAAAAAPLKQGELIIGPRLARALVDVDRAAVSGRNVLITGESGAGKELAAKRFHRAGPHAQGPLVSVNCAAIPQGVAERLLFGARRGAYSGAAADADGYVQSADRGVLFLDEFGEIDLEVQAKLLRVIETQEVLALGATQPRRVNVRFCFATHRNVRQAVAEGRFRSDLYYRIAQPHVALPPLRERLEEIPWHICGEIARADPSLVPNAELVEACMLRPWPGNVRELCAAVRHAAHAVGVSASKTVRPEHLPPDAGTEIIPHAPSPEACASEPPAIPPKREPVTKERLHAAFREHASAVAVARALGIHRSHLYRLMKQHGIDRTDAGPSETEPPDGDDGDGDE